MKKKISVRNGSLVLPAGLAMDTQSMRIRENQGTSDVTSYGVQAYGAMLGTGTPVQRVTAFGFPFNGVAASNPGFGAMAEDGGDVGATATITIDTGCTLTGSYINESLDMDHSRIRPAAPTTMELLSASDITPTWATGS